MIRGLANHLDNQLIYNLILHHYTHKNAEQTLYLASLRALCMADSMIFPEVECSLGIGTAIKIPVPSLRLMFASAKKIEIVRKSI